MIYVLEKRDTETIYAYKFSLVVDKIHTYQYENGVCVSHKIVSKDDATGLWCMLVLDGFKRVM